MNARLLSLANVVFVLALTVTAQPALAENPRNHRASDLEKRLIRAINRERVARGKPSLAQYSGALCYTGRNHAEDMQGFSDSKLNSADSHNGSDGSTSAGRIRRFYPNARLTGENISWISGDIDPVQAALDGWLDDAPHTDILMGDWDRLGVGIAVGQRRPPSNPNGAVMTFYTVVADFVDKP